MCNMDCFSCEYPDCINNSSPTKQETEILRRVLRDDKPKKIKPKEKYTYDDRHREYYQRNKERIKARQRAYVESHRAEINERRRKARKALKEVLYEN